MLCKRSSSYFSNIFYITNLSSDISNVIIQCSMKERIKYLYLPLPLVKKSTNRDVN